MNAEVKSEMDKVFGLILKQHRKDLNYRTKRKLKIIN